MATVRFRFVIIFVTIIVVSKTHYVNNYLTYRQVRFCDGYQMCCHNFQPAGYRYNYWEYRYVYNLKYYCNRYLGYCRLHFHPGYYSSGTYFSSNPCQVCQRRYYDKKPKLFFASDDEDMGESSGDNNKHIYF